MKRIGDRSDGKLIRDLDAIHVILNSAYPHRTENEACILDVVDLTAMNEFLEKKNKDNKDYKYTMFQFVVSVMAKLLFLRPELNNFVINKKTFRRNYKSVAFTIKKVFDDKSDEGLAIIKFKDEDNFDTIHNDIESRINKVRDDDSNKENNLLNFVDKCPAFLIRTVLPILRFLDRHGKLPKSIINNDPDHASIYIANLGSIGLNAGYHHLNEWGTNSIFCVIGKSKKRPFYEEDGSFQMKESLEFGLVVDERIADGYYFAKSIKLAKYLFSHPDELNKPFATDVDYE